MAFSSGKLQQILTNDSVKIPKNQLWFMAIMHALGYMQCDLLVSPSFDPENLQTLHETSNFVYIISNNNLYFVNQANNECRTLIQDDENQIQALLSGLNITKTFDLRETNRIANLSLKQILFIENLTSQNSIWGGMCRGISVMAVPANLLGQEGVSQFNNRLKLAFMILSQLGIPIDLENNEFSKSMEFFAQRSEKAKKHVLQNQHKHKKANNDAPVKTSTAPSQIVKLESIAAICDFAELTTLFQLLAHYFKDTPFSMPFGSPSHDINISYHPGWETPFVVTDANNLPSKNLKTASEVSSFVAEHLFCGQSPIAFHAEILLLQQNQVNAQAALKSMIADPQWLKIQEVTPEKAQLRTLPGESWLHCAAFTTHKNLIHELLVHGADPTLFDDRTNSPYIIAHQHDAEIAAMMWEKICAEFKQTQVDVQTAKGKMVNKIIEVINGINSIEEALIKIKETLIKTAEEILQTKESIIKNQQLIVVMQSRLKTDNTTEKRILQGELESLEKALQEKQQILANLEKSYQETQPFLAQLETHSKTARNNKLLTVNQISNLKRLEKFIELIRNKLIAKNINKKTIEHIFDKVYERFPKLEDMANELAKIAYQFKIIDILSSHKKLNNLEKKFQSNLEKLASLIGKIIKISEFLLKTLTLLKSSLNNASEEYKSFNSEILKLIIFCNEKARNGDIDLVTPKKLEREAFGIILLFLNQLKAKKTEADSDLTNLLKIFNDHGINLNEQSPEILFNQFIDAIHSKPRLEEKATENLTLPSTATAAFAELEQSLSTPEEKLALDQAILDMRSFFDGVIIAQNLTYFNHLTTEPITSQAVKSVIPFVSPVLLDAKEAKETAKTRSNETARNSANSHSFFNAEAAIEGNNALCGDEKLMPKERQQSEAIHTDNRLKKNGT